MSAVAAGVGKIAAGTFARVIAPRLGAVRREVLVGPRHGVDAAIVALGGGQVMAVTTDPLFVMPEYGWERAAWFAIQIVASDAWTSGLAPAYLTVDLNLPVDFPDPDLDALWSAIHAVCCDLDLAVVTGHTGRYDGCAFPIIGALTAVGVGPEDRYLTAALARPGDAVILTKGAAIETTAMFGATFPRFLAERLGPGLAGEATALWPSMTIVPDARAILATGVRDEGITSLHDATERGVYGALAEVAQAAGTGIVVEEAAIVLLPAVRAVCALAGIDPYAASSEGTMVATCRPHRAGEALRRLADAGIKATRIGELRPVEEGMWVERAGEREPLRAPASDPFWPAFERARIEWPR